METGSMPNNVNSNSSFDPNFTHNVINATGPNANPRLKEIMPSLIRHVHDFAREVNLTMDEWLQGVALINAAGKMSTDRRNEGNCCVTSLGWSRFRSSTFSRLVDEITYKLAAQAKDTATVSAVLGPFWRHDAPRRENGSFLYTGINDGETTFMHGEVIDTVTKQPVKNALVDVWQASTNGLYEQQDENQADHNLRGVFKTDEEGRYSFYCLRPTPYPIPYDGPAGKLLKLLDRHPMRPAHIHFIVTHDEYEPLTTQIFDRVDKHLENDAVFAVKDSLIVDFVPLENDPKAKLQLKFDVLLVPQSKANGKK